MTISKTMMNKNKIKIAFAGIFTFLLLFAGCDPKNNSTGNNSNNATNIPKEKIKITLREAWFPWAGYAGEVVAQNEVDERYNVDFVVEAGAEDIDPIKMVIGGNNDFGIASAENLILSNMHLRTYKLFGCFFLHISILIL